MWEPTPDYIAAIISFLRSIPAVTALVPTERIRGRIPEQLDGVLVQPKSTFIIPNKAGGFGANPYLPIIQARVDLRFYASNHYRATEIWRTVHPYLEPPDRFNIGFDAAGCRITDITLTASPLELVEPDGNWPVILVPYSIHFVELAV